MQADLRLCWSHIPYCWKPHALAHLCFFHILTVSLFYHSTMNMCKLYIDNLTWLDFIVYYLCVDMYVKIKSKIHVESTVLQNSVDVQLQSGLIQYVGICLVSPRNRPCAIYSTPFDYY